MLSNALAELKSEVENFNGCELKKGANKTVFSDGNPNAKIMLIGEAPGAKEDSEGIPFCGSSGKFLREMLVEAGLDRTKVYMSNAVFWRPPHNRRPTKDELDICRPFVEKHIALVSPKILILVGRIACHSLLDTNENISNLCGKYYKYSNQYLTHEIDTTVIYHPSYIKRWKRCVKSSTMDILKKIADNYI